MYDEVLIFDIETDGLIATRLHVMSYCWGDGPVKSTTDTQEILEVFNQASVIVGHNIVRYDIPTLERLIGLKYKGIVVDTLANSWYLRYTQHQHGLEYYGIEQGRLKKEITDWENLSISEYISRCETDVKINRDLWNEQLSHFNELYPDGPQRILRYLSFKMRCLMLAERSGWKVDTDRVQRAIKDLSRDIDKANTALQEAMPRVPVVVRKSRPSKPYKKDGSLSALGAKWNLLLEREGLPESYSGTVEVETGFKEPNPNSVPQVKDWLISLGWEPKTFEYVREERSVRKIPQVTIKGKGKVCDSVLRLASKEPAVNYLAGLALKKHRLGIFKGFLKNIREGKLQARASGFTNTLRLKHAELVNLPGVDKEWGAEIRGSLIAREGYELVGSDLSSLEDNTKKHYIHPFDPKFVEDMSKDGYDPHLDLAYHGGAITKQEASILWDQRLNPNCKEPHKIGDKDYDGVRKVYKGANYACVYGVQAETLSRQAGISIPEAQKLIDTYWRRNKSVLEFVDTLPTKKVKGQMWVYNPVSEFWYPLKADKDKFSTVNQSTGAYVFDTWLKNTLRKRNQLTGQFHDEYILEIKKGHRDKARALIKDAIKETNQSLNLNVYIDCSVDFGDTYGDIH